MICAVLTKLFLLAPQLVKEPVDGAGVIAAPEEPLLERRVRDERPGRPSGIEFCCNALKQVIDLGCVVCAAAELDVPDLVPVHLRSRAFVPIKHECGISGLYWLTFARC